MMEGSIYLLMFVGLASFKLVYTTGTPPACSQVYLGNIHLRYPQYLHMMGIYEAQEQQNAEKPVYKHQTQQQYLFYEEMGFWFAGPVVGDPKQAVLRVRSSAGSPDRILSDWWPNSRGRTRLHGLRSVCAENDHFPCPSGRVKVTGLSKRNPQAAILGEYLMTNQTHNFRPVYYQEGGNQRLVYNGVWMIGSKFRASDYRAISDDRARRPELIVRPWQIYMDEEFHQKNRLKVRCVGIRNKTCSDVTCQNGGLCVSLSGTTLCHCPNPYLGEFCERNTDCGAPPAVRGGTLAHSTGRGSHDLAFYRCRGGSRTAALCQPDRKWRVIQGCTESSESSESESGES